LDEFDGSGERSRAILALLFCIPQAYSTLSADCDGSISVQDIMDTYKMEILLDSIDGAHNITSDQLGSILQRVFRVKPKRKMFAGKKQAHNPRVLKRKTSKLVASEFNTATVVSSLPPGFIVKNSTNSSVEVMYETDMSVNNSQICN
jgi:hypothetical protein